MRARPSRCPLSTRTGRAQVVDFDALPAADQLPFQEARIPGAWAFLPTALAANDMATPEPVVVGVIVGAVNQDPSGVPQLSNGVLAFTNAIGGGSTGSDVPYQLLYDKTGDLPAEMLAAISELAAAGAQIIVLPFGWSPESQACASDADPNRLTLSASDFADATSALRAAIEAHPDVLFVASAGNCGADASSHTPGGMPSAPTNLLTVAATDPGTHDAASFSNHGSGVDVAAPGVGVPGPIGYDDQGPVVNAATSADTAGAGSTTADVTTGTGTSASAALTAGVGGLYLAVTGPLSEPGVMRLAQALRESEVVPGSGLPGVPRLDALRVLESTVPSGAPALPLWGAAVLAALALGIRLTAGRGSVESPRGRCLWL